MNEIKQRKIANQYKDYYKFYNAAVRPVDEKKPTTTVQGTVQWNETDVYRDTRLVVVK